MAESASDHYVEMVMQMRDELGEKYGWKSKVARRLGVHQTLITKLANGKREGVAGETVEKAIAQLGIASRFFYGPRDRGDHYTAYLEDAPGEPSLDTSTVQPDPELLDTISQLVAEMDLPDDVAAKLRASPWEGGLPSYGTLRSYAMDLMLARKGKIKQAPPLEHTPTQDGMFLDDPPKKRGR